jgi:hypothetical protein
VLLPSTNSIPMRSRSGVAGAKTDARLPGRYFSGASAFTITVSPYVGVLAMRPSSQGPWGTPEGADESLSDTAADPAFSDTPECVISVG